MATGTRPGLVARVLLALVRLYQSTTIFRSPRCRFSPTCSQYAVDAITMHGAMRGSWLAGRRLLRCHPFHAGGVDPVPPATTSASRTTADDAPVDAAA